MKKDTAKRLQWITNRLRKKYKIPAKTTNEVLGAVADLAWDWKMSSYDLYGIQIEEALYELGVERCPQDLKNERL